MKKRIITKVRLFYTSKGLNDLPEHDAVELLDIDDNADAVSDGYLIVDEMLCDDIRVSRSVDGSTAEAWFTVFSTYDGPPEDFEKAIDDGWIVWPCETEGADIDGDIWTIADHYFKNEIVAEYA